jgi:hypothetical protein
MTPIRSILISQPHNWRPELKMISTALDWRSSQLTWRSLLSVLSGKADEPVRNLAGGFFLAARRTEGGRPGGAFNCAD